MVEVMVRILQRREREEEEHLCSNDWRRIDFQKPGFDGHQTHLHGPHGVVAVVMDGHPLALWVGVPEAGHVDHVTVVEGDEHGEDARGGMHRLL